MAELVARLQGGAGEGAGAGEGKQAAAPPPPLPQKLEFVAVVSELTHADGLVEILDPDTPVYLDEEAAFKNSLGNRKLGFKDLLRPSFLAAFRRAGNKHPGVANVLGGDGFTLGGVLLVEAGNDKPLFLHLEEKFGDLPDMDKLEEAIRM